jgi:hypothetical protein
MFCGHPHHRQPEFFEGRSRKDIQAYSPRPWPLWSRRSTGAISSRRRSTHEREKRPTLICALRPSRRTAGCRQRKSSATGAALPLQDEFTPT